MRSFRKLYQSCTRQISSLYTMKRSRNIALLSVLISSGAVGYSCLSPSLSVASNDQILQRPLYTRDDVKKHKTMQDRIWVTYKNGVYDVTDFIEGHPGGKKILLAAGGAVDPFWKMYQQHLESNVLELLEEYRIGDLDISKDKDIQQEDDSNDLFANEPKERHPALIVKSSKPFNAEPPVSLLADSFLTPVDLFYIRNHLPVPIIKSIGEYKFTIEREICEGEIEVIEDGEKKMKKKYKYEELGSYTMNDLSQMKEVDIIATLQCAGNRRSEMAKEKPVQGLQWEQAAIGTSKWTGVRLRDVLKASGGNKIEGVKHVHFEGLDRDALGEPYGASIPIETALSKESDVILAYKMNGETLPRDHGYPVRVVVPGHVGARNVKWVHRIILSDEESRSHWQRNDYKLLSPFIDWTKTDASTIPAIQELPVQSVICIPENGSYISRSQEDSIKVAGYAVSGGGRDIVRVDISMDGGVNWTPAKLTKSLDGSVPPVNRAWGWTIWSLEAPLPDNFEGPIEIICKAVDTACNQQPESIKPVWNVRGLICTTWHRSIVNISK